MKNVIRSLAVAVVVCGSLFAVGAASAQGFGFGGGYGGGYGGFYPSTPRWHDTSHFDYHPAHLQRHGNHFDYVPGHYDFHRSGHWDW